MLVDVQVSSMKIRRSGSKIELAIEPLFPVLQDVGAVLFGGVRCLSCA
jgi:hypothetical protein